PAVTVAPPTVVQPAPRVVAPLRPFVKRSPFERPRVLPACPECSLRRVPPVVSSPRSIVPAPRELVPTLRVEPRVIPATPSARIAPTPSKPISGKLILVTVKPGDTLWKFAASRLGDGHRWQELLSLNPGLRNPDLLEVGSQIVVPVSLAAPRAPTKYTV